VSAYADWLQRGVWQAVYGDAANNNYELLLNEKRYSEQAYRIGAFGSYTLGLPVGKMTFAAAADFQTSKVRQQATSQRFSELSDELLSPKVGIDASVRYAFPIWHRSQLSKSKSQISSISFFFKPAAGYTYYTKTTHQCWQVVLYAGICF
jgi:hypothetical protein